MCAAPAHDAFDQAKQLFFDGLKAFETARFDAAEQLFLASLALLPGRVSTLINLAATQLKLSRPQEALAVAEQVLAVEADNADAWFHKATALGQLNRHREALAGYEKVLQLGILPPPSHGFATARPCRRWIGPNRRSPPTTARWARTPAWPRPGAIAAASCGR